MSIRLIKKVVKTGNDVRSNYYLVLPTIKGERKVAIDFPLLKKSSNYLSAQSKSIVWFLINSNCEKEIVSGEIEKVSQISEDNKNDEKK